MAINKARKDELVALYSELLQASNGFAVVRSSGLTVAQVENLRGRILEVGGQYMVTKNTLLRIALQQVGWDVPEELLAGPTSVAFGKSNFPGVAKAVLDFIKEATVEEKMRVTGGMMSGSIIGAAQVDTISKLPSLDELRSQLAGLIVAPATGLVTVLDAANSQIVNVLQAYIKDRGGEAA